MGTYILNLFWVFLLGGITWYGDSWEATRPYVAATYVIFCIIHLDQRLKEHTKDKRYNVRIDRKHEASGITGRQYFDPTLEYEDDGSITFVVEIRE